MRKRSWYLLLLGAALLLAILVSPWIFREDGAEKGQYRIAPVKRGKILSTITCTGTVNPLNTVIVGSQVSGNIEAIYVDFNSEVEEGQIIARIDPAVYSAQLEQTKGKLHGYARIDTSRSKKRPETGKYQTENQNENGISRLENRRGNLGASDTHANVPGTHLPFNPISILFACFGQFGKVHHLPAVEMTQLFLGKLQLDCFSHLIICNLSLFENPVNIAIGKIIE